MNAKKGIETLRHNFSVYSYFDVSCKNKINTLDNHKKHEP